MTLTFEFPLPENLGNGRMHHMVKWRRKKAYEARLDTRLLLRMLPARPAVPFAKASAIVEVRTWRACDPDNATARCKWPIDWLTTRGYVVDDSPKHLSLTVEPTTASRDDLGITLRLTRLEEASCVPDASIRL